MSYAVPPPVMTPAPARRPVPVTVAAVLLVLMAVVGLGYAVLTMAVVPGVLDRFRREARADGRFNFEAYSTGVWVLAAIGLALGVILFALLIALAVGLRRGSNAARIGTWVVCGLGLLFGCGSTVTVAVQRSGEGDPGTLGVILSEAYPGYWIGLNLTLSVAQMVGYLTVAVALIVAPAEYFRPGTRAEPSALAALPPYGSTSAYPGPSQSGGYPAAAAVPSASGPPPPGGYPPGASPTSPGPPQPGPDDEYWARPSS